MRVCILIVSSLLIATYVAVKAALAILGFSPLLCLALSVEAVSLLTLAAIVYVVGGLWEYAAKRPLASLLVGLAFATTPLLAGLEVAAMLPLVALGSMLLASSMVSLVALKPHIDYTRVFNATLGATLVIIALVAPLAILQAATLFWMQPTGVGTSGVQATSTKSIAVAAESPRQATPGVTAQTRRVSATPVTRAKTVHTPAVGTPTSSTVATGTREGGKPEHHTRVAASPSPSPTAIQPSTTYTLVQPTPKHSTRPATGAKAPEAPPPPSTVKPSKRTVKVGTMVEKRGSTPRTTARSPEATTSKPRVSTPVSAPSLPSWFKVLPVHRLLRILLAVLNMLFGLLLVMVVCRGRG